MAPKPSNSSSDHPGTPRVIRRATDGVIVWRWDSDPFGVASPNENPSGAGEFKFNLRFPGQYADAETGLNYNYFRDYNPKTGRYAQSDPIGLNGGLNTFGYANVNPLTYKDEFGLDPWAGWSAGGRIDMLIGGFGARSGVLVNLKTRETCQVAYRCMNLGIGALASLGSDASIGAGGPSCGKDLGPIEIGLSVEVLTPAGTGFNCSVDVVGAGVSAGIGPSAGIGAFVGGSICELRTISCQKTPRSCLK